jgi:hypothetical protein
MRLTNEDRSAFRRAGSVEWDSSARDFRWSWETDIPFGYVVYLMVVEDDVKKGGKAEDTRSSTFKKRMEGEFGSVRQVISGPIPGRPLARWRLKPLDPFKKHAPPVLLAGNAVVLFAKAMPTEPTPEQARKKMREEEDRLNIKYRGEWTKEGWTRNGTRRFPEVVPHQPDSRSGLD